MNPGSIKRFWLRLHVSIGMGLGLLFVFAGLTGSVLVFHRAIDAWLNPAMLKLNEPAETRSLDELLALLRDATPDLPAPTYLDLPQTPTDVIHAWYRLRAGSSQEPHKLEVWLHPSTGEILGRREDGTGAVSIIYDLHREWLSGNVGETAVGIVGVMLVLSIGTGVALWWPGRRRLRDAFRRRTASPLQQHYYRHQMTGISAAAVLVLVACSGIFIEFHEWVTPAIRLFSHVPEGEPMVYSREGDGGIPISAQQAIAVARQRFPDADITYLMLPDGPTGVYMVGVRQPDDVLKTGGSSGVWVDQYRGDMLAVRDWTQFTAGETFVAWMFPLHNGEAFGTPGRVVVSLGGFAPLVLYVTAVRMWWLKRRALHRQRSPSS